MNPAQAANDPPSILNIRVSIMQKHQSTHQIPQLYHDCRRSFSKLLTMCRSEDNRDLMVASKLADDSGRFRIWAESAGAHRKGSVSLEYRLREASKVKHVVIKLLEDLRAALQEESPEDTVSEFSESSTSSSENGESDPVVTRAVTELEDCCLDISHVVGCLYKFSVAIRNPASRDLFRKCSKIDVSHYEAFDLGHVTDKFPVPDTYTYLIERLAKANTRRRQLLKYYEMHHEKIVGEGRVREQDAGPLGEDGGFEDRDEDGGFEDRDYLSESNPETTATTFVGKDVDIDVERGFERDWDAQSEGGYSQTSFASSINTPGNLRVPPPPDQESAFDGDPFLCPYCRSMISVNGRQSWTRHVFRDLQPYVCTFEDCQKSDHMFGSRHEWFEHERSIHRREWHCNICDLSYGSSSIYRDHVQCNHRNMFMSEQLQVVIDRGERSIDSKQPCPLCSEDHLPRRLQSHLGRHLQQIALFVLPGSSEDFESDSASDGDISSDEVGEIPPDAAGDAPSDEVGEIPPDEAMGAPSDEVNQKMIKILDSLSQVHYKSYHIAIQQQRVSGTCEWLLRNEQFQKWKNQNSSSLLWLCGSGPLGKSVSISKVIDYLLQFDSIRSPVAYFYCKRDENSRSNSLIVLATILKQILSGRPFLYGPVVAEFEKLQTGNDSIQYSFEDVRRQLFSIVKSLSSVYILINDVDECGGVRNEEQQQQLLRTLSDLVDSNSSSSMVKIMVSSRNFTHIDAILEKFPTINVTKSDISSDMELYIRSEIRRCKDEGKPLGRSLEADLELEKFVIAKMISKAHDFSYVNKQIQEIADCATPEEVRRVIEESIWF
ncbi:hypothetical protein BDD12DRAFT_839772 [Trichophaea hybrida]|nr:hypothetical protein BDD12DRAFT_839772 [Trichophaea hybrida]